MSIMNRTFLRAVTNGWRLADNQSPARMETMPRLFAGNSMTLTSGSAFFAYFTPDASFTAATLGTIQNGTSAATVTLSKMGLYSVAANGNLTCIARTANTATLWQSLAVAHTAAIADDGAASPGAISSIALVRGQRYAFAAIFVGTTAPSVNGKAAVSSVLTGLSPTLATLATGQTDLPASIASGSLFGSANVLYGYLV